MVAGDSELVHVRLDDELDDPVVIIKLSVVELDTTVGGAAGRKNYILLGTSVQIY